eukprot:1280807-Pyramimonas_sp.AAC.1
MARCTSRCSRRMRRSWERISRASSISPAGGRRSYRRFRREHDRASSQTRTTGSALPRWTEHGRSRTQ